MRINLNNLGENKDVFAYGEVVEGSGGKGSVISPRQIIVQRNKLERIEIDKERLIKLINVSFKEVEKDHNIKLEFKSSIIKRLVGKILNDLNEEYNNKFSEASGFSSNTQLNSKGGSNEKKNNI